MLKDCLEKYPIDCKFDFLISTDDMFYNKVGSTLPIFVMTKLHNSKNILYPDHTFIEWVKKKFYQHKQHNEVPESRQLSPTIADIKEAVCQLYKENEKVLEVSKRGQVNEPRNIAIYLARKHSGLKLSEIGVEFGLEKYSSVSSIVIRTEQLIAQRKLLKQRVEKIRSILIKSHAKI